jgi:hypothetical protein
MMMMLIQTQAKTNPRRRRRMTTKISIEEGIKVCHMNSKAEGCSKYYCQQCWAFCGKGFSKFLPHLERIHSDVKEVWEIVKAGQKKELKKRKDLIFKIHNRGNFQHNVDVLKARKGELLVGRRPPKTRKMKVTNYAPSVIFLLFCHVRDLCRHKCLFAGRTSQNLVRPV